MCGQAHLVCFVFCFGCVCLGGGDEGVMPFSRSYRHDEQCKITFIMITITDTSALDCFAWNSSTPPKFRTFYHVFCFFCRWCLLSNLPQYGSRIWRPYWAYIISLQLGGSCHVRRWICRVCCEDITCKSNFFFLLLFPI